MNKNIAKHAKAKHALACEFTKERASECAGTRVGKSASETACKSQHETSCGRFAGFARLAQSDAQRTRRTQHTPRAKRTMAVLAAMALVVSCLFSGVATGIGANAGAALTAATGQETNAVPKTEVVYAKLAGNGALQNTYVVNTLEPEQAGTLCDFGSYESVQNLTNASELGTSDQAVFVDIAEGQEGKPFSYQASLGAAALPWNVSVSYTLDGKSVSVTELAGATGALNTEIAITRNPAAQDDAFFENYLVTATVTLASDAARNIQAPDAQMALSGSDTQLTFMVMPGKEKTVSFTADVTDFEMSSIQVAAIPFAIAFDFPDTNALISQFSQLTDAAKTLDAAAVALASGANDLASGVAGLQNGAAGVSQGVAGIAQGLTAYQQGVFAQAAQSQGAAEAMGSEKEVNTSYEEAMQEYLEAFVQAFAKKYAESYAKEYAAAYAQAYQKALMEGMDEQAAAQSAAQQATQTATQTATGDALEAGTAAAEDVAEHVQEAVRAIATRASYVASARALQGAAAGLGSAADQKSLIGGASSLAYGSDQFTQGIGEAVSGATEYAQGSQEFSQGMSQFQSETAGLPSAVQAEMDALMADYDKSDFEPRSFVSSKNTNVKLVQFVMSTPEIVVEATDDSAGQDEDELTPLDRLLALFR